MSKTVKVTFGDVEYEIPQLRIGQVRDLLPFADNLDALGHPLDDKGERLKGKALLAYRIDTAQILFRFATPKIANVEDLEVTHDQLLNAIVEVYRISDMVRNVEPGEAKAGANGAP